MDLTLPRAAQNANFHEKILVCENTVAAHARSPLSARAENMDFSETGIRLSARVEIQPKKKCKSCHFHLTSIGKIRSYLDRESTEAIIHAFVTTNLDYWNAILYGLPKVLLNRLQLVQNRAARIVTFTKKYEHITPSFNRLTLVAG